ncbi:hypothetical protein BAUCODRAFT_572397 [Baudoinia panamericana UAMH 10762]|uniref:Tr-type G domain-containing protein n=1 Tax=Baudoinia panamericana (strain UAMH 10762) TaxID=717646 RepID=M2MTE4_BAUPA|nr:uncharacterized protein BAUCODRAFT_572397 [Baudoinia panamericana UAMH 10762]EMD00167.1 hypothetical protein BAUCODRAFT_572397 [Baudoinia panamericana UAMH 10762]
MASVFTYEPETPRVASPWLSGVQTDVDESDLSRASNDVDSCEMASPGIDKGGTTPPKVTRLQAEPQLGPVEYKLHLLLRPRRKFRSTSTGDHISGSRHARYAVSQATRSVSESALEAGVPSSSGTVSTAVTQQSRQHRLEQLTTQLLWRLQQSSPHHASSATNMIIPSLPEALPELQAPRQPDKLLHGLEESQGALYEIGVADDGTLVGLAEDELLESLNNLRAMAACLGCSVELLRKEIVGDCEWVEDVTVGGKERRVRRSGKLVVAEALIKPHLQAKSPALPAQEAPANGKHKLEALQYNESLVPETEQLRITLTGPTMSGKSSLLGTLTTSTLDNGRGKSRLSMLKHRHEITTGVTSSVTQEILGYRDAAAGAVDVINYAAENIASWIDIHVEACSSRLVFISDSAGHPRYRRTTIRSLDTMGRRGSTNASQQKLGAAVSDMDLSGAQLALCLTLNVPLVVVITKLDLASRSGLRDTLSRVLDALKAAGRKPAMLANEQDPVSESDLQTVAAGHIESAYNISLPLLNDPLHVVPIVLTSALRGTGVRNLHALLHELPLPATFDTTGEETSAVFHIEDVYTKPSELEGIIVSGRVRSGQIAVGDSLVIGPLSGHEQLEDSEDSDERPSRRRSAHLPTSRSFPGAMRDPHFAPHFFQLPGQEWRRVKTASIRNLRLPVHSLLSDQVGTIAIVLDDANCRGSSSAALARVRKGMVLTKVQPLAIRTFVAEFKREDLEALAVGNHVVVYIASVRASAKVVSARAPDSPDVSRSAFDREQSNAKDTFSFDDVAKSLDRLTTSTAGAVTAPHLLVTFSFDAAKEFIMVGDHVLVMPGGGPGLYGGHERGEKGVAGLEGFVGKVTEACG